MNKHALAETAKRVARGSVEIYLWHGTQPFRLMPIMVIPDHEGWATGQGRRRV
jgi:hypothetical protein